MDKNIPLSQLIRIGSKITEKCTHNFCETSLNQTCALGAAYLGKFGELPNIRTVTIKDALGITDNRRFKVHLDWDEKTLFSAIVYLNDDLGWTREEIADWVESQGL